MSKRRLRLIVRLTEEERDLITRASGKMEMTMTELVTSAIELYANIPPAFLAELRRMAKKVKLPVATVFLNLAQTFFAQDKAIAENFGSKTWERAFRFDPRRGLITDDSLTDLVFEEINGACADLKEKMATSAKNRKPLLITKDETILIAASR